MRALISKVLTGSMIAGAALLVSACGSKTETTTTVDNTLVTDLNATEGMDTMSDNMTAVDGTVAGNTTALANDTLETSAPAVMTSNTTTTTTTK